MRKRLTQLEMKNATVKSDTSVSSELRKLGYNFSIIFGQRLKLFNTHVTTILIETPMVIQFVRCYA